MNGLYKITNPKGQIYIGSSKQIENRLYSHKKRSSNKTLRKSIIKYGWNNHTIKIIKINKSKLPLNYVEKKLIVKHIISGFDLMNDRIYNKSLIPYKTNYNNNIFKNLKAKSICKSLNISYRNVADSFKHQSKLSISMTDRKKVVLEVEKTLNDLIKIYEL